MFCTKCGKDIQDGSKFCGSCGTEILHISPSLLTPVNTHKNETSSFDGLSEEIPDEKSDSEKGVIRFIWIVAGFIAFIVLFIAARSLIEGENRFGSWTSNTQSTALPAEQVEKPIAQKCSENLECYGKELPIKITGKCKRALSQYFKYASKWDDGVLTPLFVRGAFADDGTVILIGDKLQLQNGFGAWAKYTYSCRVDRNGEQVIEASVEKAGSR